MLTISNQMKKKILFISSSAALSITFAAISNSRTTFLTPESCCLTTQDIEVCTSCEVTASAHKLGFKVAEARLECVGKGTCVIPTNEFGLTASCSGKLVKYDLSVLGKKVN